MLMHHNDEARAFIAARRRQRALEMLSSAGAVVALMVILAFVYRFATGASPWPVFVLVEIPSGAAAFAILAATAPKRT